MSKEATAPVHAAAAAAAAKRSKKKGGKRGDRSFGYLLAIGGCMGVTIMAVFLALTGESGKKKSRATSALDNLVNDNSAIKSVNNREESTFTAAAMDMFKGWSILDAQYSLDGQTLSPLAGMAGAIQYCEKPDSSFESGIMPINFDGRQKWPGCIADVVDSGNCSAGYAVAAATSLAARYCVADAEKYNGTRLSSQQVLSCDKKSRGCEGGGIDAVWAYVERRGLYPEACLPFKGKAGAECKTDCDASKKLKTLSHCMLREGDVKAIKKEILKSGPVVVPVPLREEFLIYSGGIYQPTASAPLQGPDGKTMLQAVTIVGWGKSEGVAFWLVQNSWGTQWGEEGYARIALDVPMEHNVIIGVPETEETLAAAAAAKKLAEEKREQARKDRAEREERLAAQRAAAAESKEQDELDSLDDSFEESPDEGDLDLDLDDLEEA